MKAIKYLLVFTALAAFSGMTLLFPDATDSREKAEKEQRNKKKVFQVNPAFSYVGFAVGHYKLTTIEGQFKNYFGSITLKDNKVIAINGNIRSKSLTTSHQMRDKVLRSKPFLHVARYPNITFNSTSIEQSDQSLTVRGQLSIKHETHEVTLRGTFGGLTINEDDDTLLVGVSLEGNILKGNYGILYDKQNSEGRKEVSDKITIRLRLLAKTSKEMKRTTTTRSYLAR